MEALEFMKKWRGMCLSQPIGEGEECTAECPLYYDYCPLDPICEDREETLAGIVEFVERSKG